MQADRQIQDLPVYGNLAAGNEGAPYPAAGIHYINDVIDPSDTRDYIIRALQI